MFVGIFETIYDVFERNRRGSEAVQRREAGKRAYLGKLVPGPRRLDVESDAALGSIQEHLAHVVGFWGRMCGAESLVLSGHPPARTEFVCEPPVWCVCRGRRHRSQPFALAVCIASRRRRQWQALEAHF